MKEFDKTFVENLLEGVKAKVKYIYAINIICVRLIQYLCTCEYN